MSITLIACPECGDPAEMLDAGTVASTQGPVALVRTRCIRRHWFLLPAESLAALADPTSATRSLAER